MNPKTMIIYGGIVLCLSILLLIWTGSQRPVEGFADKGPEFVMIHADWCGHCKNAKPDFEKLAAESPLNIGQNKVYVRLVNGESEEGKALKVEGYPTFRLYKPDGRMVEYTGGRTIGEYKEFLAKELAN